MKKFLKVSLMLVLSALISLCLIIFVFGECEISYEHDFDEEE